MNYRMTCSNEHEGKRLAREAMDRRNFPTTAEQIEFLLNVINQTVRTEAEINKLKVVVNGDLQ